MLNITGQLIKDIENAEFEGLVEKEWFLRETSSVIISFQYLSSRYMKYLSQMAQRRVQTIDFFKNLSTPLFLDTS